MCQADDGVTGGDGVAADAALQPGCNEDALNIGIVAKLRKKQTLMYVIHMEPGQAFSAKSLGEHILAIVGLLSASAEDIGAADLTALISELKYEGDAITIGLTLVHTPKGELMEAQRSDEERVSATPSAQQTDQPA